MRYVMAVKAIGTCPICGGFVGLRYWKADRGSEECRGDRCTECGCCDKCEEFWTIEHECGTFIQLHDITEHRSYVSEFEAVKVWETFSKSVLDKNAS